MREHCIFHIDVNNAFLSWEACRIFSEDVDSKLPDLRTFPSAIGGDSKKRHGIILAKSIPAKKFGVVTGEPIHSALIKCPTLLLVPPTYRYYDICSKALMKLLRSFSPVVEQLSIDEAFCDMSGMFNLYASPLDAAHILKNRIRDELGFTVNIGISSNKLLAKMASDFKKPDLVHTLYPHEIQKKMWPMPVRELYFVGSSTEQKLKSLGIHTIGDLALSDKSFLISHLKKQGEMIYNYANGIDYNPVANEHSELKGYGNSTTLSHDVIDAHAAKQVILSLTETVCARLRADHMYATVVAVEIKDNNFIRKEHQITLYSPTNTTNEVYLLACQLFDELWDNTPIRLLGVRTSKVTDQCQRQLDLFTMESNCVEKLSKLDSAIDKIRNSFGDNAVMRASFLDGPINHMTGKKGEYRKKSQD